MVLEVFSDGSTYYDIMRSVRIYKSYISAIPIFNMEIARIFALLSWNDLPFLSPMQRFLQFISTHALARMLRTNDPYGSTNQGHTREL